MSSSFIMERTLEADTRARDRSKARLEGTRDISLHTHTHTRALR